jgi:O-antigen/teichoic acid export membrane protein
MTLKERIFLGIKENLIEKFVTILLRILEPIIYLHFLSLEHYGEWLIIYSLPYYLALSDLGFGSVVTNQINMLIEKKKILFSKYLINNLITLTILFNVFFGIIFYLILFFLYSLNLIHINLISEKQFLLILILLTFVMAFNQINNIFLRLLAASGYYHFEVRLSYLVRILELILIYVSFIYFNKNLFYISLAILSSRLIFFLIILYFAKLKIFWLKIQFFYKLNLKKKFILKYWSLSILSCIFPVGQALRIQASTTMIGFFINPTVVAMISIYLTISRIVIQFTNTADGILKIEFAKTFIKKKHNLLRKYYIYNFYLTFIIAILLSVFLFFFGQNILKFWLHNKVTYDSFLFNTLLIYSLFSSLYIPAVNILTSSNNFKKLSIQFIFLNTMCLLTIIFLIKKYQLYACIYSMLFYEFLLLIMALKLGLNVLKIKIKEFFFSTKELNYFISIFLSKFKKII